MSGLLLATERLGVALPAGRGRRASLLRGVDLAVPPGGAVALVGESGSGKTLTALALLDLLPAGASVAGRVLWRGRDRRELPAAARRRLRGGGLTLVPQEPQQGLDPVCRAGDQVAETVRYRQGVSRREAARRAAALLREVRLPDPEAAARAYPHQLSGGMRQRILIAAALACEPELLIADEPTTALDVTVQARIVELLRRLRERRGMALLHITHDLAVAALLAERVEVLCAGEQVESGPARAVLGAPAHPYTRLLVASLPESWPPGGPGAEALAPAAAAAAPGGCSFTGRCPRERPGCRAARPARLEVGPGHWIACRPEVAAERRGGGGRP